jgi:hypothetical protein
MHNLNWLKHRQRRCILKTKCGDELNEERRKLYLSFFYWQSFSVINARHATFFDKTLLLIFFYLIIYFFTSFPIMKAGPFFCNIYILHVNVAENQHLHLHLLCWLFFLFFFYLCIFIYFLFGIDETWVHFLIKFHVYIARI